MRTALLSVLIVSNIEELCRTKPGKEAQPEIMKNLS
jgi:hypothetical protein